MGLELTLWTDRLDAIKEILANAEKQTEELRESYGNTERELQQTETRITDLTSQGEALTVQIEQIRARNKEKEEIVQQKKAQILVAENDIEHAKKDIGRMTESLTQTDADAEKNAEMEKTYLSEIAEFEKKLAEKDAEIKAGGTSGNYTGFGLNLLLYDNTQNVIAEECTIARCPDGVLRANFVPDR